MAYKALTKKLKIYVNERQMAILKWIGQVEISIKTDTSKEVTQIKELEPAPAKLDDSLAPVQNPLEEDSSEAVKSAYSWSIVQLMISFWTSFQAYAYFESRFLVQEFMKINVLSLLARVFFTGKRKKKKEVLSISTMKGKPISSSQFSDPKVGNSQWSLCLTKPTHWNA